MIDLVITDLHLNPRRQGGTTMESRAALEDWQFSRLADVLTIPHDRLIIVGDLFDAYSVSDKTLLSTYNLLKNEKEVIILRGNHDSVSDKYNSICSLQLLGALLGNVNLIFDAPQTLAGYHFVPHCFNQEAFDKCIEEVPEGKIVFIHANYDNSFALEAAHSLNLSREQFDNLYCRGCHVILGHEHAARDIEGLTILGCTIPTSIADCLGGSKRCMTIEDGVFTFHETFSKEDFLNIDYTEDFIDKPLIRINGECEVVEFTEITRKIAKRRAASLAFIIANNVKVRKHDSVDVIEAVTAFNIIDLFMEQILPEFKEEVQGCI